MADPNVEGMHYQICRLN